MPADWQENYIPEPNSGCWLWLGQTQGRYGLHKKNNQRRLVHRVVWEEMHGPIPDGRFVCHHCDVPLCVNPDHLFVGTADDNNQDKVRKGRQRGAHVGGLHHNAKLTDGDVTAIRTFKLSPKILARMFGISRGHVHDIKSGRKWRA